MATTSSNFAPDKHDGPLGVNYATCDGTGALGPHSILYSDEPGAASESYTQGATGFNHGEMVYNRRRFNSAVDPARYNVNFQRGDLNPPMINARNWVEREVFGNSPN